MAAGEVLVGGARHLAMVPADGRQRVPWRSPLAATLGDIGAVVRHAAERISDAPSRRAFDEAVDAIDDGLAADVVLDRLARAFGDGADAAAHLRRRVAALPA